MTRKLYITKRELLDVISNTKENKHTGMNFVFPESPLNQARLAYTITKKEKKNRKRIKRFLKTKNCMISSL